MSKICAYKNLTGKRGKMTEKSKEKQKILGGRGKLTFVRLKGHTNAYIKLHVYIHKHKSVIH
jgi:hypothetical protein